MTDARRTPPDLGSAADALGHLIGVSTVIVTGATGADAAAVELARRAAADRRVAIGDLTGTAAAMYALAGGEDAPGLAESFRDGLGLTEIARPVAGEPSLFVLPAGSRVADEPALGAPDRWNRLMRGFADAGGLLVLIAPATGPATRVLVAGGAAVIAVGRPTPELAGLPVIATVGAAGPPPWHRRGRAARPIGMVAVAAASVGALVIGGGGAAAWHWWRHRPDGAVVLAPRRTTASSPGKATAVTPTAVDTVHLDDRTAVAGSLALPFSVELMSANSASGANLWLRDHEALARAAPATVSLVVARSGSGAAVRRHRVNVGAFATQAQADSALLDWRGRRWVERDAGRVVRTPVAVLVADSTSHERAAAVADVWRAKGEWPVTLAQSAGARVFVGAFETAAQGAAMARDIQRAGGSPVLAIRTGRYD